MGMKTTDEGTAAGNASCAAVASVQQGCADGNLAELSLIVHNLGHGARAFTTTRKGGVSKGSHGGFNINPYCGDDAEAVTANRSLLAAKIGVSEERIVVPHQVHGTEIRFLAEEFFAMREATRTQLLDGVDGLLTDACGACIGVSTADCIPVLLHDPRHHIAAAVHAGWRGTASRIAAKAVEAMTRHGSRPEYILACLGPGISFEAFEVGEEVREAFVEASFDMDRVSRLFPSVDGKAGKWHIDLWECNRLTLVEAGLAPENVSVCRLCTYSNFDTLFSARRLGTDSGRLFSAIVLDET